jgi:uncharacterized membrane protein YhaH (DUF805 family)
MERAMAFFYYFFGFSGRIARLHWWVASLTLSFLASICFVGATMALAAGMPLDLDMKDHGAVLAWLGNEAWKFGLAFLPCVIGQISLAVRRYHDRGKAGWWALLAFVPAALWIASIPSPLLLILAVPASIIVPIWQLVELGFLAGTPGSNDFGPDPREGFDRLAAEIAAMGPAALPARESRNWSSAGEPARPLAVAPSGRTGPPVFGRRV